MAFKSRKSHEVLPYCLTFSLSMKLGETVTYPHLEGVSLCGSVPIQSVCPVALMGELDLT